ncbi:hypothetical protein QBC35DRAFT_450777 [Podospora australis]|uniref:Uncharacterized protein n=1 Tax=Podospora australis TaxID=1536484 RepID=A0AAN6WVB5_9PEZI|nr:hypothetical protein QBC35DRAFT_450777 [Podospora australis]
MRAVALLSFGLLHLAGANPVPDEASLEARAPPLFVCDDNNLAKKCQGDPYHSHVAVSGVSDLEAGVVEG